MSVRNVQLGGADNWADGQILASGDVNSTFNVVYTWVQASH